MVQPSCPVTDREMGGVGVGEQREELSRPAEQEWPWKEDRRPEGEVAAKGLPYQVLGHGLGPDVEGEAAQLRRVLKFTIKVPKSIGRMSSLEKAGFLKKKKERETDSSLACLKPQWKIRRA